jgi:cytochrome c553
MNMNMKEKYYAIVIILFQVITINTFVKETLASNHIEIGQIGEKKLFDSNDKSSSGKFAYINNECIICHSVNGLGGQEGAPKLNDLNQDGLRALMDASGSKGSNLNDLVEIPHNELTLPIELTVHDLGAIVEFVNNTLQVRSLTEKDIPVWMHDLVNHTRR